MNEKIRNIFSRQKKCVSYAIGTGRCGTKFISELLSLEPNIASCHERNNLNETFHRYGKWYNLPIDSEGFLSAKEKEMEEDFADNIISFEASAFLSFSVLELFERFNAKFLFLVRSPEKVVNSYYAKGYYAEDYTRKDNNLALGFQSQLKFHHFLGRIVPSGEEYEKWVNLTRVGKIAWYWNVVNKKIVELLNQIPEKNYQIIKLEEFDYRKYTEFCKFLGHKATVKENQYKDIVESKPNKLYDNLRTPSDWSGQERAEFEEQVSPMAEHFGYESKVDLITGTTK